MAAETRRAGGSGPREGCHEWARGARPRGPVGTPRKTGPVDRQRGTGRETRQAAAVQSFQPKPRTAQLHPRVQLLVQKYPHKQNPPFSSTVCFLLACVGTAAPSHGSEHPSPPVPPSRSETQPSRSYFGTCDRLGTPKTPNLWAALPAPELAPSKTGQRGVKEEPKGFSPNDRTIPAAKGHLHPAITRKEVFHLSGPRTTCPVTSCTVPARLAN